MNTKERFEATFAFQPVDRPLLDFYAEPGTIERLLRRFGVDDLEGILGALHVELRNIRPEYTRLEFEETSDGGVKDIWGVIRKPVPNPTGVYMEPVHLPWADMRTLAEVEAYPWPKAERNDFSTFRNCASDIAIW